MKCTPAQVQETAHPTLGLQPYSEMILGMIQMRSKIDVIFLRYAFDLRVFPFSLPSAKGEAGSR
jgi:hypothetical protein